MARSPKALLQIPVVLLALASTPGLFVVSVSSFFNPATAQTSEAESTEAERTLTLPETFDSKPTFTVPKSLAEDTEVTVNGSSSMIGLNRVLEERFEERFPDADVELAATGTNEALEALQNGELDIAAVGRPLTEAEKAAGLVAVPVGREKLAIIVSPDNPFDGNLTFEQFARMFRGEITNWSEVGGTDGEIQFVDRPDDSDTRRALSTYDVFEGIPFETGFNTTQVGEDETDAVVAELGDNGIGYAIADQVLNRDDVKIISMHQTLPDDPRYPYSQYRSYVYNDENKTPAVVAFLGLATTAPGQEVVAETDDAVGVAPVPIPRETSEETSPVAPPVAADSSEVAQTPGAVATAEDEAAGFPLWLIPLLGLPLLGALFWFLKGGQGQPVADAPPPTPGTGTTPPPPPAGTGTTPPPPTTGTGTATPPTPPPGGTGTATPPAVTGNGVTPLTTGLAATPPTTETPTPPVTPPVTGATPGTPGGIAVPPGLGAVAGLGGLAAAGAAAWWAGREPNSRITLVPGDSQDAYAYWNVPDGDKNFAKENGGRHPQLRIYDVTGIENPDQQIPDCVQKYDWDEATKERPVPNLEGNRDYLAEIGYATDNDQWLMLARSNQVHIPEVEMPTDGMIPNGGGVPGLVVGAGGLIGAGGLAALLPMLTRYGSHITLRLTDTPTSDSIGTSQTAEAYWEVPNGAKATAKEHGGQYPQVRLCDVTGVDDVDRQTPVNIQKYDWDEVSQNRVFQGLERDHTYLAEIGYETDDAQWLKLARSNRITVPQFETPIDETTPDVGLIGAGGATTLIPPDATTPEVETPVEETSPGVGVVPGLIGLGGLAALLPMLTRYGSHITLRLTDTPTSESIGTSQTAEAYWEVPDGAKNAAKEHGGQYPQVRLCDVTGVDDVDRQTPVNIQKYDWDEWSQRQQFPNLDRDRTYLAEIGYETDDNQWLRLARSNRVTIPEVETAIDETTPDAGLIGVGGATTLIPPDATTPDEETPVEETSPGVGVVPGLIGLGGLAALLPMLARYGSHITLRLTDTPQTAEAYWEVPNGAKNAAKEHGGQYPQVRLCDVTGVDDVDRQTPLNIQKYDWNEWNQRQQFPNLERDHTYLAEIGYETDDNQWLRLARSNRVTIVAVETPADETSPETEFVPELTRYGSHITLKLTETPQTIEAYWEAPHEAKTAAKNRGGQYSQIRICDVTGLDDVDRQTPLDLQKYHWHELTQRQQFPNLERDHTYLAEIGYETDDGQWLRLARSNRVTIVEVETSVDETSPETGFVPGLGVGGAAALIPLLTRYGSHITLRLIDTPQTAEVYWEVPSEAKNAAKEYGGQSPQVRLCDVTGVDDVDRQTPVNIQKYHWDEFSQNRVFLDLEQNCTYLAEIGYETADDQWLRLARSNRVTIPSGETTTDETTPDTGVLPGLIGVGLVGTGVVAGAIAQLTDFGGEITLNLADYHTADARWTVPDAAKTAAKERGGRQMQLRIYDVTNVADPDTQSPNRVRRYDCEESAQERRVPIADQNCEYLAEIGYITDDGQWLMLARSNRVEVPETELDFSSRMPSSPTETGTVPPLSSFPSSIVFLPTDEGKADVRWDIPDEAKEVAKGQGGRQLQLRVYDLTDTDGQQPGGNLVLQRDCDESDWQLELEEEAINTAQDERDYLAEIGYVTENGEWLVLGCSEPIRIPANRSNLGRAVGLVGAGVGLEALRRERATPTTSSVTLIPSDNQIADVYWIVPDQVQEEIQQQGGHQFQLHIYDVTDIPPDSIATHSVQQYDFDPSVSGPQRLQLEGNHEYFAEIGYLTADGEWLMVTRSYRVRIPAATNFAPVEPPQGESIELTAPDVVPTLDPNRCGVTLIPCDNEAANVYWDVPDAAIAQVTQRGGQTFQLHVYDVTDIPADSVATHNVEQYDFDVALPHPELLHLEGNHEYFAEIGYLTADGEWLRLARSYRVRIPAMTATNVPDISVTPGILLIPGLAAIPCRMTLFLGEEGTIDTEWEVPDAAKALAKQQGGYQFQVRAYDVTNTPIETPPSVCVEECSIAESISSWQFELESDREYLGEVGYITEDGRWLVLARSNRLLIPTEDAEDGSGSTALFTGVGTTEAPFSALSSSASYITLSIAENEWVDARWEVPDAAKASAKERGGQKFQLHVYEVTDIDLETQPAHSVQRYNCNELIKQWQVPNLKPNCEYLLEIGYVTDSADWLMLARSNRVRVPEPSGVNVSSEEATSSQITLVLSDNQSADAHWEVPRATREMAKQQGGQKFQLRIYDVTGIDIETQSATIVRRYNCHEFVQQLQIPNLGTNREYLVEMGYVTDDDQWMILARSNSVRIPGISSGTTLSSSTNISSVSQVGSSGNVETVTTQPPATTGNCAIQHLTVDSRRHCHLLTPNCMKQIEEKAVSHTLEPGIHVIRIKSGTFGYGPTFVGEPFVILWIYGGTVINKKTRIPVDATWSTLNGYHETLTLEVQETSQLSAFFFDTYPDDNEGEVTISVARLYDAL